MATAAQTSLQAFLFTDIVGSTDLKRRLGDAEGAQVIMAHDAAFRDCAARFDGVEQNNPGDGFFATFSVPSAALNCALAFQAALKDQPLQARVGIHMGESVHVPGTAAAEKLLGLAVDTAGRVMSLAMPNQILITRHAFDSARQNVLRGPADERVVWRAHGAYHFKGLDEPIEIHEAGIKGIAPLAPPPDSSKAHRAVAHGEEATLGWRPGAGLDIPGRSGWRLERKLGAGGFGEAWLAVSRHTKERRAFKFCFQADRLRSLKRELTLFRVLKETLGERDDIARLYDVSLDEAPFFLEMEYTPDGSLDGWAVEDDHLAAMTLEDRAEFVAEIAAALGAAHSVGVLHKDVKPPNILVRKDATGGPHARLTDFGIGQLVDPAQLEAAQVSATGFTETGLLTDLGSRTGTRLYMAPELFAGKPASTASDIYGLGVLLYQMIAGDLSRPLAQGWERDIPDPLLVEDIAHCVAGDPRDRPASCDVVAERLRSLDARRRARAEKRRRVAAEARRAKLLRVTAAAAVLLLMASVAGFIVAGVLDQRRRDAEDARDDARRERDAKARALAQVLRLSDAKKVSDLLDARDGLWPVHPDRAPAMADWLSRAQTLLGNRPGHEEALAELRVRAQAYTDEQRRRDHAATIDRLAAFRAELAQAEEPGADEAERTARAERRTVVAKETEKLTAAIEERASWSFSSAEDDWRHQVLSDLLAGLKQLDAAQREIAARHEAARTLAARSIDAYRADWDQTIQAIAASRKYDGLKLVAQLDLVPLGPDPKSGLFEFAHLSSGAIPKRDPKTKRLVLTDDFAVVLVLIPGVTFWMGAQETDPDGPNYEPEAL
ncbi:MAG: protein kinase, partial [Planctomycetota bacterium]|nr:protein kinase [Planctomycetota bacterium]